MVTERPDRSAPPVARESTWLAVLAAGLWIGPLAALFTFWTADAPTGWIRFLLAVTFAGLLPGRFLVGRLRLERSGLERVLLGSMLGLVTSTGLYWACMRLGLGPLWLVWPLVASAATLWLDRPSGRAIPRARGVHVALAALFLTVVAPLAITPVHFRNFVAGADGALRFFDFDDVWLHLSIANELGRGLPPEIPFLPGMRLDYHYGPDLLSRLLADLSQASILDVSLRFLPALYMAMLVLAIFCFARLYLRRESVALLAVPLVVLGEGLAYLPGALLGSEEAWSAFLLRVPTTPSLYMMNPMLPGLALLFAAMLALSHSTGTGPSASRVGWILTSIVLITALFEVKIFAAAHLLACVALVAAIQAVRRRGVDWLVVVAGALVVSAPSLVGTLGGGGSLFRISFGPSGLVGSAIARLGLATTAFGRTILDFEASPAVGSAALVYATAALVFVLAVLGARSFGLATCVARFREGREGDEGIRWLLAVFVLAGPVVTLFCSIRPTDFPRAYDNAVWFFVQSAFVAWIPAIEAMSAWTRDGSTRRRVAAYAVFVALSLPAGLQYVERTAFHPGFQTWRAIGPSEREMLGHLDAATPSGAVVLAPPRIAKTILALTDCRAPLLRLYTDSFVSRDELFARKADLDAFWHDWARGRVRMDLARRWRATHVVVARPLDPAVAEPVFANADFAVYELEALDRS